MNECPKLSIIIPIYNKENFLRRCLDSIKNQTHRDLEVWMVDDGSTDGSADICKEYEEKDHRFHYIHQENHGWPSVARNTGLGLASGEWVGFPDPDDYVEPTMYETLLKNSEDADMVMCNMYIINTKTGKEKPYPLLGGHYDRFDKRLLSIRGYDIGFSNRGIYKRSIIGDLKYINTFCEDSVWTTALLNKSQNGLTVINDQLYNYFIYPDSLNHRGFSKEFLINSFKELHRFLFKEGRFDDNPDLKNQLINHLNRYLRRRYGIILNFQ